MSSDAVESEHASTLRKVDWMPVLLDEEEVGRRRKGDSSRVFIGYVDALHSTSTIESLRAATTALDQRFEHVATVRPPLTLGDARYAIEIRDPDNGRVALQVARELKLLLETAGASGQLSRLISGRPRIGTLLQPRDNVSVVMSLTLDGGVQPAVGFEVDRAAVTAQALLHSTMVAARWCSELSDDLQLNASLFHFDIERSQVAEALLDLCSSNDELVSLTASDWPRTYRKVTFTSDAHVILSHGSGIARPTVDEVTATSQGVMRELAPAATYGFALRAVNPSVDVASLLGIAWPGPPRIPHGRLRQVRSLEQVKAIDAFPYQYFGPKFPPREHYSEFQVATLDTGGHILASRHAEDWLSQATYPPAHDLETSRQELDSVLIRVDRD